MLPDEAMILHACRAMEVSAAFPYARAHRQERLGERVIINDLYGVPVQALSGTQK